MRVPSLFAVFAAFVGTVNMPVLEAQQMSPNSAASRERQGTNSFPGKTIRWTFADGPTAGITFEHSLNTDGSITWRALNGAYKGASGTENSYAAEKISDRVWAISYLAASGHTLTVVLNLDGGRAVGFASNEKEWSSIHGTFEIVN